MSTPIFHPTYSRTLCAGALLLALGACSFMGAAAPQQLEVHAMLGERELHGVGCMLANDSGRWTVVAPGRVTVVASRAPLSVDCLRQGAGSAAEQAESPAELARLDAHQRIAAEGARAYPATINVKLLPTVAAGPPLAVGSPLF